jgi:hypothetical protein
MRIGSLIRSGWWVVAAAVVLTLAAAAVVLVPLFSGPVRGPESAGFDLSNTVVSRELIVSAMPRDGVHVLVEPATIEPDEADRRNQEDRGKFLVPDDRVIGVSINDEAIAYPLRLMRWHEVVNDIVGDQPVAVTYSPLCDSVTVFSRELDGETVELGVSGLLYNSNTLLYDRRAEPGATSLWIQLDGRVAAGPGAGLRSPLSLRIAQLTTWKEWRNRYPHTRVLAPLPNLKRIYRRDPYHSYFGSDLLRFPVQPLPPSGDLRLKARVVVVTVDGKDSVFSLASLATEAASDTGDLEKTVDGLPFRISFRTDPGVAMIEPLAEPHRLQAVRYAFWFAWYALGGTIPATAGGPQSSGNANTENQNQNLQEELDDRRD